MVVEVIGGAEHTVEILLQDYLAKLGKGKKTEKLIRSFFFNNYK